MRFISMNQSHKYIRYYFTIEPCIVLASFSSAEKRFSPTDSTRNYEKVVFLTFPYFITAAFKTSSSVFFQTPPLMMIRTIYVLGEQIIYIQRHLIHKPPVLPWGQAVEGKAISELAGWGNCDRATSAAIISLYLPWISQISAAIVSIELESV